MLKVLQWVFIIGSTLCGILFIIIGSRKFINGDRTFEIKTFFKRFNKIDSKVSFSGIEILVMGFCSILLSLFFYYMFL